MHRKQETVVPTDLPLVQELGTTLREWTQIWHTLYVVCEPTCVAFAVCLSSPHRPFQLNTELPTMGLFNKDKSHPQCFVSHDIVLITCSSAHQSNKTTLFRNVQQMAYSLIEYRSQIVSGTLPNDDLVELKKKVTAKIDYGNRCGLASSTSSCCSPNRYLNNFHLRALNV